MKFGKLKMMSEMNEVTREIRTDEDFVVEILLNIKNDKKEKKKDFDERTLGILNAWLQSHKKSPYPTVKDKEQLCLATGCTIRQINNWFGNARRRKLRKGRYHKPSRKQISSTSATDFVRPVLNYYIKFFSFFPFYFFSKKIFVVTFFFCNFYFCFYFYFFLFPKMFCPVTFYFCNFS